MRSRRTGVRGVRRARSDSPGSETLAISKGFAATWPRAAPPVRLGSSRPFDALGRIAGDCRLRLACSASGWKLPVPDHRSALRLPTDPPGSELRRARASGSHRSPSSARNYQHVSRARATLRGASDQQRKRSGHNARRTRRAARPRPPSSQCLWSFQSDRGPRSAAGLEQPSVLEPQAKPIRGLKVNRLHPQLPRRRHIARRVIDQHGRSGL